MAQAYFYLCAVLAVAGALGAVLSPNPIRGAMGLLMLILSVAGLFLALHAQFLAAIQVIVYAGAIIVLFLFVIMLLGPSAQTPSDRKGRLPRILGGGLFGLSAMGAMALVLHGAKGAGLVRVEEDFGGIDQFGRKLFSDGLVPFELSSALLMVAVIGAVAVARGKQAAKAPAIEQTIGGPLGGASLGNRALGNPAAGDLPGTADPIHGGH